MYYEDTARWCCWMRQLARWERTVERRYREGFLVQSSAERYACRATETEALAVEMRRQFLLLGLRAYDKRLTDELH